VASRNQFIESSLHFLEVAGKWYTCCLPPLKKEKKNLEAVGIPSHAYENLMGALFRGGVKYQLPLKMMPKI
jgi:hypothetical protein